MIVRAVLIGWLVLLVVLVASWWRARDGRFRASRVGGADGLGGRPRVTSAVLVTTPTCRTCPQVRAVLADVAAQVDGFSWEEVDAATDLDFVRAHRVRRAPTVLFRDPTGTEVGRAAGPISHAEVAATVGWSAPVTAA